MVETSYQSPIAISECKTVFVGPRLLLAVIGLSIGTFCGAIGAFIGGALEGFTFRLSHNVVHGGPPFFDFLERLATPVDFALYHGTLALLPLAAWGGFLGFLQGGRITRERPGIWGIVSFAFGGLLVGIFGGGLATGASSRLVPDFIEGPLAGGIYGMTTSAIAWRIYGNFMMAIVQRSRNWQVTFVLLTLLSVAVCLLILCGVISYRGFGPLSLQVASRFGAILSLAIICAIAFLLRNHHAAQRLGAANDLFKA